MLVRRLRPRFRLVSDLKLPMFTGIEPSILFFEISISMRDVMRVNVAGILPNIELELMSNTVKFLKLPISVGSVPWSEEEARLIAKTLAYSSEPGTLPHVTP